MWRNAPCEAAVLNKNRRTCPKDGEVKTVQRLCHQQPEEADAVVNSVRPGPCGHGRVQREAHGTGGQAGGHESREEGLGDAAGQGKAGHLKGRVNKYLVTDAFINCLF